MPSENTFDGISEKKTSLSRDLNLARLDRVPWLLHWRHHHCLRGDKVSLLQSFYTKIKFQKLSGPVTAKGIQKYHILKVLQ